MSTIDDKLNYLVNNISNAEELENYRIKQENGQFYITFDRDYDVALVLFTHIYTATITGGQATCTGDGRYTELYNTQISSGNGAYGLIVLGCLTNVKSGDKLTFTSNVAATRSVRILSS